MRTTLLIIAALIALTGCDRGAKRPETPPPPAPASIDLAALQGHIVALGSDPSWRLDGDAQLGLLLVRPDQDLTVSENFAAPQRVGERDAKFESGRLTVALSAASCTLDGATYPMTASVQVRGGDTFTGCAFSRWDAQLTTLLPAIDACLSSVTEETPLRVTYAAPEPDGRVLVRMRIEDGGYDCRAPRAASEQPPEMAPADPALRIGGDGDAIFIRAPGENPGGQCYEAPEVRAADGTLLGWMDDPQGC